MREKLNLFSLYKININIIKYLILINILIKLTKI